MGQLILKSANASCSSGEWSDDDYDVLADGVLVGRHCDAERGCLPGAYLGSLVLDSGLPRTECDGKTYHCWARGLNGSEPGWDRTSDLLIKSQLLYH